jgi:hypothetical protein
LNREIAFILAAFALCATPAFAHHSSVTHIDAKVTGNALVVTLNLNQIDLLEHVLGVPNAPGHFADRQEYEDAAPKILDYVIDRLSVSADGKRLAAPSAPLWPVQHVVLTHVDGRGLEVSSPIPLTLNYALPAGTDRIELFPRLYTEPNFTALVAVTVDPGRGMKSITMDGDSHQSLAFTLRGPAAVDSGSESTAPPDHNVTQQTALAAKLLIVIMVIALSAVVGRKVWWNWRQRSNRD